MKNLFKLFGIVAIVAVMGFSMAACEEEDDTNGDAYLTIVNQFDRPVTEVLVTATTKQEWNNLNITKGNSQTFTITEISDSSAVKVTCSGDTYTNRIRFVEFKSGKTVTITVNAAGDLVE